MSNLFEQFRTSWLTSMIGFGLFLFGTLVLFWNEVKNEFQNQKIFLSTFNSIFFEWMVVLGMWKKIAGRWDSACLDTANISKDEVLRLFSLLYFFPRLKTNIHGDSSCHLAYFFKQTFLSFEPFLPISWLISFTIFISRVVLFIWQSHYKKPWNRRLPCNGTSHFRALLKVNSSTSQDHWSLESLLLKWIITSWSKL